MVAGIADIATPAPLQAEPFNEPYGCCRAGGSGRDGGRAAFGCVGLGRGLGKNTAIASIEINSPGTGRPTRALIGSAVRPKTPPHRIGDRGRTVRIRNHSRVLTIRSSPLPAAASIRTDFVERLPALRLDRIAGQRPGSGSIPAVPATKSRSPARTTAE